MANVNEILLLSLLYFGQGLPYGFQIKVLPLFLRTRNLSLSRVSLSRLLSLPWIFKFALAPLVDSIWTLRFWITSGLLGMTTFCLVPAILGVTNTHILLVCVFGMNLTTAAQDVAVDVFALRLLPPAKLGIGSTVQVIGYKVGVLFGGGLLSLLSVSFGWDWVFFVWGCFYTVAALLLACQQKEVNQSPCPQLKEDRQGNLSAGNSDVVLSNIEDIQKNFASIVSEQNLAYEDCTSLPAKRHFRTNVREILQRVLQTPNFVELLLWVLTYKLGEQGMASLFPLYLLDQGIPQAQVGMVFGIFGQLFSIVGSAVGGWIVHHCSSKRSCVIRLLLWTSYGRLVPMSLQWMLVFTGAKRPLGAFVAVECLAQTISGTITTATFTLVMSSSQSSPPGTRASNCAILATAEVLGKLLMISFSGVLVDLLGYRCFFGLCLCLACFTISVVKATDASSNKKVL